MSHTFRRMQLPDDKHLRQITDAELPTLWRNERPTPQQQANDLVLWIGDNQETQFKPASIDRSAIAAWIGLPISPPNDSAGWVWLHSQLKGEQLYEAADIRQGHILGLQLTMKGMGKIPATKKDRDRESNGFHGHEIRSTRSRPHPPWPLFSPRFPIACTGRGPSAANAWCRDSQKLTTRGRL